MPIYDYKCTNEECNAEFERIKKLVDRAKAICPECSSEAKQAVTAPGYVHGGFYDNIKSGGSNL
ncbi:hypothetical protein YenMTG1_010 [Yersinia phage vB_YenM_TG1]|uniref:Putative regulatory protein FmdB zinc ribbon domain-containing protein n=2 Tax=Tegunavirus TaxID=1921704 RepID=A0A1V0DXB6_9CAUD|nr:FmdB-like transcriptional regulator [Yersinia phage vB_YenM_TG1]YP_010089591.1 FmdB-like transcriptional regulator [Yersinia phage fHe-Yen9-01]AJD81819.1 hypothetical protein YenMTG1_010 [Yersinia phage vB_YenM_TG1]ARB05785.1 hypothetical protein fHeYen901_12 [Yersinia phage fHe-Yen9-01]